MQKIIFATGNGAKLAQLKFIINHFKYPIKVIGGKEVFRDKVAYDEMGENVDDVARNGAIAVAKRIGQPIITEDTDFRIEALGNEPGIRAGEFLKKFGRIGVLERMQGIENRKAVITSAVGYAMPSGKSKIFINQVPGTIALQEKFGDFPDWIAPTPENSFGGGYNAIFIPDGWSKTLAEISPKEAIPWSYREKNFIDVVEYLLV